MRFSLTPYTLNSFSLFYIPLLFRIIVDCILGFIIQVKSQKTPKKIVFQ
jgi:hypothetical protein